MQVEPCEFTDIKHGDGSYTRVSNGALVEWTAGLTSDEFAVTHGMLWHESRKAVAVQEFVGTVGAARIEAPGSTFALMVEPDGTSVLLVVSGLVTLHEVDGVAETLQPLDAVAMSAAGRVVVRIKATVTEVAADPWIAANLAWSARDLGVEQPSTAKVELGAPVSAYPAAAVDRYVDDVRDVIADEQQSLDRLRTRNEGVNAQIELLIAAEQDILAIVESVANVADPDTESPLSARAAKEAVDLVAQANGGALAIMGEAQRDLSELYGTTQAADVEQLPSSVRVHDGANGEAAAENADNHGRPSVVGAYTIQDGDHMMEVALLEMRKSQDAIESTLAAFQELERQWDREALSGTYVRSTDSERRASTPLAPELVLASARRAAREIVVRAEAAVNVMYDLAGEHLSGSVPALLNGPA
jgi:hypothetical protein